MATDEERYESAIHAVQSAVAFELQSDPSSGTPKHLRVGVNSAMAQADGLVRLLIEKGVFSEAEYVAAVADAMEREAEQCAVIARRKAGVGDNVEFH